MYFIAADPDESPLASLAARRSIDSRLAGGHAMDVVVDRHNALRRARMSSRPGCALKA